MVVTGPTCETFCGSKTTLDRSRCLRSWVHHSSVARADARRQQQLLNAQRRQHAALPPYRSSSVTAAAAIVASPPAERADSPTAEVDDTIGVLLLNLGGPETLEDVQPFLYNLFADPDIIRLPSYARFLQPVIAKVISTLRAPKSSEGYRAIGGGSPLRTITLQQADALSEALRRKGQPNNVYVAMRYWKPFTEDAIAQVKKDGVKKLVVLPLYPQFSISTSGSSLRLLESLFKEDPDLSGLLHTVIPSWYHRPGYITAMTDLIQAELNKFDSDLRDSVEIFFSAHGVPKSYVEEAGDPYKAEMEECIRFICQELRRRGVQNSHTLAYQSRVGPVEWLKPYTDESIKKLGQAGCRSMLAVPVSFVSEHIETLDEMDVEYRELAEESGITSWRRVPALNTNSVFVDDLADAVVEALPYAGSMAGSNPSDAMVPLGDVEALLETYDKERRVLPMPLTQWKWGWTQSAETWNGRIAMLAIVVVIILETITGQGVLNGRL